MHRYILSTATAFAFATPAFAGPVAVPPPLPPVIVDSCPQAFDCFYGGLELGFGQGEGDEIEPGTGGAPNVEPLDFDGEVYGVFAGYNFQNGSMIYGGEVRFLHMNLVDDTTGFEVSSALDLRARVGYVVASNLMVYGAAGYTMAQASAFSDFDLDGFNYGVGAEYNISESFFVGGDLTGRQLEGSNGGFDYEVTVNTATLRLGFRF